MVRSIFLLVIAMASIQFGATMAKGIFPVLGAAGTSAMRLTFATIILWLIFKPWQKRFTPHQIKKLAIYGLSLGIMNLTFYFALERIPLGIAVALEFTGPLAVAIFTSKHKMDYLWAFLAGVGIFLLLPAAGSGSLDIIGIAFALAAGFFWAMYILYGKKAGDDLHGGTVTAIGMTFAALVAIPFGVIATGTKLFDYSLWPYGLAVAVLSSALPYSLEMVSLKNLPTKTFGVLMSLEPAIAAFAGLLFLGEALTLIQWMAILCIIISSFGSSLGAHEDLTQA